jgi:regulatory protein
MLITQISPQKRNSKRVNVFLDGEFSFSLDRQLLLSLKLKENQSLTQDEIEKILKENEMDKWWGRTLKFLSYRPRSEKEILNYLSRKEVGESLAKLIIEKLKKYKLVNDVDFARWVVEQRQGRQARGKRAISLELKNKGLKSELIEEVISETIDSKVELENALKIASIKVKKLSREIPQKKKEKLTGFLLRRGFGWEIVNQVLRKLDVSSP